MKFFHLSDLHIGKRVNGYSMLEDQRWILRQILELAKTHHPDGVLIAGDLYDKSLPSAEAVELVDDFLYGFVQLSIPVWVISGNHDSAERVAYGGRMMEQSGIYVSRVFDGTLQCCPFETEKGERADIYLLPFLRPATVQRFCPDREITTTQQAVEAVLEPVKLRSDRVNLLVMHQFMAGAAVCESEEQSVGGSDQVDASLVRQFDYVALGHLHGPQSVGRACTRYSGSPLKYSFSEAGQKKSVTVVEIDGEKTAENRAFETCGEQVALEAQAEGMGSGTGAVRISGLPLTPLHDLREIRGPIAELLKPEIAEAGNREDYLHVTLTDEGGVLDAIGRLRSVYPNIMRLDFAGKEQKELREEEICLEEKDPMELFAEFFEKQYGAELTAEQSMLAKRIWKETVERKEGDGV